MSAAVLCCCHHREVNMLPNFRGTFPGYTQPVVYCQRHAISACPGCITTSPSGYQRQSYGSNSQNLSFPVDEAELLAGSASSNKRRRNRRNRRNRNQENQQGSFPQSDPGMAYDDGVPFNPFGGMNQSSLVSAANGQYATHNASGWLPPPSGNGPLIKARSSQSGISPHNSLVSQGTTPQRSQGTTLQRPMKQGSQSSHTVISPQVPGGWNSNQNGKSPHRVPAAQRAWHPNQHEPATHSVVGPYRPAPRSHNDVGPMVNRPPIPLVGSNYSHTHLDNRAEAGQRPQAVHNRGIYGPVNAPGKFNVRD